MFTDKLLCFVFRVITSALTFRCFAQAVATSALTLSEIDLHYMTMITVLRNKAIACSGSIQPLYTKFLGVVMPLSAFVHIPDRRLLAL
ncbi:hypothetical protein [uncultured Nostoc sp.]|uniref:hypothetical protein n=1 Tax=uncultured Nostoc sp. TaxID=340711 RepID=UPI0035C9BF56